MLLIAGAFKHFKTISVMILKHKIKNICVSNGDFRLFSTQIVNLTTTSVQIACATEGRLIECFYHILAVGYTG